MLEPTHAPKRVFGNSSFPTSATPTQIVAAIEQGAGEFRLPWHRSAGCIMRPTNVASRKRYNGVNILALWASADAKGCTSGLWGTFKQWADAGASVRKGEKASHVVFYKEFTVAGDRD